MTRPVRGQWVLSFGRLAEGWRPGMPKPVAHLPAVQGELGTDDVFSTATPVSRANAERLSHYPDFFRMVVPPLFVEGMTTHLFEDSPALRALCDAELRSLLSRFRADRLVEAAEPVAVPEMPVLDAAREGVASDHFAGCELLAVQHLYASTVGLMDALRAHGLEPADATVIGKSYSTHFPAARALRDRGFRVPSRPLEQHALDEHDALMEGVIRESLQAYREKVARGEAKPTLLVLDDGGQIIELAHREFPDLLPRLRCVEQTTRGMNRVEGLVAEGALHASVVDVAGSDVKVDCELPLVAASVLGEVRRKLLHLEECGFPKGKTLSLLGFGRVAKQIARLAKVAGYEVRVHDPKLTEAEAKACGVTRVTSRRRFFEGAEVLVSATGARPMKLKDWRHLPHRSILFNAASSNDELASREAIRAARAEQTPRPWWSPRWREDKAAYLEGLPELLLDREYVLPMTGWLWGELDGTVLPLGHVARRERRDRVLHFEDKDVYLANSGFVVNLTDEADPIPARYIQVTRAALFAGCVEAVAGGDAAEVRTLSGEAQSRIRRRYESPDVKGERPGWTGNWAGEWHALDPLPQDTETLEEVCAPQLKTLFGDASRPRPVLQSAFSLSPAHVLPDGVAR